MSSRLATNIESTINPRHTSLPQLPGLLLAKAQLLAYIPERCVACRNAMASFS